jgi:ATP dependent DNA ligase C terminal region
MLGQYHEYQLMLIRGMHDGNCKVALNSAEIAARAVVRRCSRNEYQQGSFVIGGYTQPAGERKHMGALLVGVYESGKLKFAVRVGTGFSEKLLKALSLELDKIAIKACPFSNLPATGRVLDPDLTVAEMKRCVWVKPSMVCEVKFTEWTRDDRLCQPVFLGLREDKNASEVIREKAVRQRIPDGTRLLQKSAPQVASKCAVCEHDPRKESLPFLPTSGDREQRNIGTVHPLQSGVRIPIDRILFPDLSKGPTFEEAVRDSPGFGGLRDDEQTKHVVRE